MKKVNKPIVHILATVRKPSLIRAATFVFDTLRVGFPTATICVSGNALDRQSEREICGHLKFNNHDGEIHYTNLAHTSHDAFIETLIQVMNRPFWLCDTDVYFKAKVEHWFPEEGTILAGRYEHEFHEEWTNTLKVARLHTCLMYIDPIKLRTAIREVTGRIPWPFGNSAQQNLIRQTFMPRLGSKTLFYDTMAGCWQSGIGTKFSKEQDAAFAHLHAATYCDLIAPNLSVPDFEAKQKAILDNPKLADGLKVETDKYFERMKANG